LPETPGHHEARYFVVSEAMENNMGKTLENWRASSGRCAKWVRVMRNAVIPPSLLVPI
jgi:sarcosine oxidase delta subunit